MAVGLATYFKARAFKAKAKSSRLTPENINVKATAKKWLYGQCQGQGLTSLRSLHRSIGRFMVLGRVIQCTSVYMVTSQCTHGI